MRINIVSVGNLKEKFLREGAEEYLKRLTPYASVKIVEIKEESYDTLSREEKNILPHLKGHVVAMAINGKQLSSPELAEFINERAVHGVSEITFVIGGSTGLSPAVLDRADTLLSFGKITLPHQLFRVVLLEQIYRAFSIINHSAYHK